MVTIYDIAKKCGVSAATVSKALNDLSDVSIKTKERINTVAKEMGYSPNSQARTLATKKSNTIGVLFSDNQGINLAHKYFADILQHLRYEVEARGYDLCYVANNSVNYKDDYYKHCCHKGFDGVVIIVVDFNADNVLKLINSDIPVVLIDKEMKKKTSILSNNFDGMRAAINYLVQCGHSDIGFIHGEEVSTDVTKSRLDGFRRGMEENKLIIHDEWIKEAVYYQRQNTYDRTKEILSLEKKPTAILLPDDYVAQSAYQAAKELGLNIPQDVSFIGCDGLEIGEMMTPQLTTIVQNSKQIGKEAGINITKLIESNVTKNVVKIIDTKLVIRESVKKISTY